MVSGNLEGPGGEVGALLEAVGFLPDDLIGKLQDIVSLLLGAEKCLDETKEPTLMSSEQIFDLLTAFGQIHFLGCVFLLLHSDICS